MIKSIKESSLMRNIFLLIFIFLAGCGSLPRSSYKIGVDPSWHPEDFKDNQMNVNAYVNDLLLEISKIDRVDFIRVEANWDDIFDNLENHEYEAVLTSLYHYNFNEAKYDFSKTFLPLGPVIITPIKAKQKNLKDLFDKRVAVVKDSEEQKMLEKYPKIYFQPYRGIAQALESVNQGANSAALVDSIFAISYVENLFSNSLKIASPPLNDEGLRLLTLKDKNSGLLNRFNNAIEKLEKNGTLDDLKKKWGLKVKDYKPTLN